MKVENFNPSQQYIFIRKKKEARINHVFTIVKFQLKPKTIDCSISVTTKTHQLYEFCPELRDCLEMQFNFNEYKLIFLNILINIYYKSISKNNVKIT